MNDTPRTDAVAYAEDEDPHVPSMLLDMTIHARTLEREITRLRDAGDLMRKWIGNDEKIITERWDAAMANAEAIHGEKGATP